MAKTRRVSKGLSTLSVAAATPTNGQVIVYNGSQYAVGYGNYLFGRTFSISNLTVGQTLIYNGTTWTNRYLKAVTISAVTLPVGKTVANLAGGETVTVTGTGFFITPRLYINQTALTNVTVMSPTTITGTIPNVPSPGVYALFLSNGDGECAVLPQAVTYVTTPLLLNNAALGTYTNNVALSFSFVLDIAPPYTFALTAGSLPTGLVLGTSGLLSGTPTAAGTYNFTLLATDYRGQTVSKAFTMIIA